MLSRALILPILLSAPSAFAQGDAAPAPATDAKPVKVGVFLSEPFNIKVEGGYTGISIELWKALAAELNAKRKYEFVQLGGVKDVIDAVANGSIDVGVGPISITAARAQRVDFSHPYFEASMGILTRGGPPSAWSAIKPFVSGPFMYGTGFLLLVLLIVGVLIWVLERKRNAEQFPASPVSGIGNGMWFALVTMTTVGYGDRAPISPGGRVVAGIWMVIAMITASSLTAGIATALTLARLDNSDISDMDSLSGRKVAAVAGTTGASLARSAKARIIEAPTRQAAIQSVVDHQAEAFVFDMPQLQAHLVENPEMPLLLIDSQAGTQQYGFVLPRGSPFESEVDTALLKLIEKGEIERIAERWLQ